MIEFVVFALVAAGAGWLAVRKHRARTAAGPAPGIPCMARRRAGTGRWQAARVHTDGDGPRWVPGRGAPVPLAGARATGVRVPSVKEAISIHHGSRIVTCLLPDGTRTEIAVMPLDLRELLAVVPETAAPEGGGGETDPEST